MPTCDPDLLREARERSWKAFGKRLVCYLPGMFCANGATGRYPALSITGPDCAQGCDHCKGTLLRPMRAAASPEALIARGLAAALDGDRGILVSGGCGDGALPWRSFIPALRELKERTNLHIAVHCGFVDRETAQGFKDAGVDKTLLDIVGSDDTYRQVFHVANGLDRLQRTLDALAEAELEVVPHLVCGLHYGRMLGEEKALDLAAQMRPRLLVILSFMPLPGTPMQGTPPPAPEEVARILCLARLRMPDTEISLGCARPRGARGLELLAVDAGVNRLVLPSEEALQRAHSHGLKLVFRKTCCCVDTGADTPWL